MACLQKGGRGELLPRAHFVKTIVILLREVREALLELLPKGRQLFLKNEKSITVLHDHTYYE